MEAINFQNNIGAKALGQKEKFQWSQDNLLVIDL
jgi:hypothetical protein